MARPLSDFLIVGLLAGSIVGAGSLGSAAPPEQAAAESELPELPRGITSFGAAIVGDWLYVYGGHFGEAHHYSNTSQSNQLSRLNLKSPAGWEVISTGPRLQGLAMVAYDGKLYRVGGFTAHNEEGAEHDLRSVAEFASFDPATKKWTSLPPLPEARSSHDAVVLNGALYVVGGWKLGGEEPKWHDTAWSVDLTKQPYVWHSISAPPFRRRALSLGAANDRIYVVGGMQRQGGPTTRVDQYDPATREWAAAGHLLDPVKEGRSRGMEGFGSSTFALQGQLFVSSYGGQLQRLAENGSAWNVVAKLNEDRFFHRMLPYHDRLILVGGASMQEGKRLQLEQVSLEDLK